MAAYEQAKHEDPDPLPRCASCTQKGQKCARTVVKGIGSANCQDHYTPEERERRDALHEAARQVAAAEKTAAEEQKAMQAALWADRYGQPEPGGAPQPGEPADRNPPGEPQARPGKPGTPAAGTAGGGQHGGTPPGTPTERPGTRGSPAGQAFPGTPGTQGDRGPQEPGPGRAEGEGPGTGTCMCCGAAEGAVERDVPLRTVACDACWDGAVRFPDREPEPVDPELAAE